MGRWRLGSLRWRSGVGALYVVVALCGFVIEVSLAEF